MLTTNLTETPTFCVKCDNETKYLIPTFNRELQLEPVCWRCFQRQDQRVNLKPDWKRMSRNGWRVAQPVYADGNPKANVEYLRLAKGNGKQKENQKAAAQTSAAFIYL